MRRFLPRKSIVVWNRTDADLSAIEVFHQAQPLACQPTFGGHHRPLKAYLVISLVVSGCGTTSMQIPPSQPPGRLSRKRLCWHRQTNYNDSTQNVLLQEIMTMDKCHQVSNQCRVTLHAASVRIERDQPCRRTLDEQACVFLHEPTCKRPCEDATPTLILLWRA